jgi:hypothetical protein
MRKEVMARYIDQTLEKIILEGKSLGEVFHKLDERKDVASRSNMRPETKVYIQQICDRRKTDFMIIYGNPKFAGLNLWKVHRLVKLRHKLTIDISE